MPPRKKKSTKTTDAAPKSKTTRAVEQKVPSTMKELKDTLWKAADKLRGSMDASQYKDIVLGLIFLKFVSDAFDVRREEIAAELRAAGGYDDDAIADIQNDPDEYQGARGFFVPEGARWGFLAENAKGMVTEEGTQKSIGGLIDDAMQELKAANKSLQHSLQTAYDRDNVDQRRLGELMDILSNAHFAGEDAERARDLLGEVYEYFLENFARAEGKRGGEFYTPASVVRVLVEILEPTKGRIYDPCCGSGGMFVQAEKFLAAHDKDGSDLSVYGQEQNERTWRMATMNMAIHHIQGNIGDRWHDTFAHPLHGETQMDYVLANPPFNIKDWARNEEDPRWRFGVPPKNNANYAWMQHIISMLSPTGVAGVVMANGSMTSNSSGEGQIRSNFVDADVVNCMVTLPTQLFRSTAIPVCLWFFAQDKSAGAGGAHDRTGQVLFIDGRDLGFMVDRAERSLADEDIAKIADTFRAWRGTESADGATYEDVPGFCKSATVAEIKDAGYVLSPGRYVGAPPPPEDAEPLDEKIERLTTELLAQFDENRRLETEVRTQLGRIK